METDYAYRQEVWGVVLSALTDGRLLALLLLMVADLILGVSVAIKEGTFEWRRLADWLGSDVLPKGLGWFAITVTCGLINTTLFARDTLGQFVEAGLPALAFGTIVASLLAQVMAKAVRLGLVPQTTGTPAPIPPARRKPPNQATRARHADPNDERAA